VRRQIPELGSDHVLDDAAFPEGECFSVAIAARAAEIAVGVAKARDLDMKVAAARRRQLPFAEQGWLALAFEHEVVVADVVLHARQMGQGHYAGIGFPERRAGGSVLPGGLFPGRTRPPPANPIVRREGGQDDGDDCEPGERRRHFRASDYSNPQMNEKTPRP
jgi:hypothetical protein